MDMNQADILVIGVIYNTYPESLRYLESIATTTAEKLTLILVDNSDRSRPPDFLKKIEEYSFVHYFETGKNLGYFGGAREGLLFYLNKYQKLPQWILVTNVDIVFTEKFFLKLNELNDRENLGVIAPSIISDRWKVDYNPEQLHRYSGGRLKFYRFIYSNYLLHNLFLTGAYIKKWVIGLMKREMNITEYSIQSGSKIYAAHGSCIVFANDYFTRGGTLDIPNFLFGEEIIVAETARQCGLDIEYHPEMMIYDYEHASIGFFVTPKINRYYKESIQQILKMYYQ
jgi:GT2 family glycosyltransferase